MQIRILVVLTVCFLGESVWAQDNTILPTYRQELIKSQLSKSDLNTIIRLERDENEAMRLMQVSDENYEKLSTINLNIEAEKNRNIRKELLKKAKFYEKKAIKNRVAALKLFNDTYVQRFIVLKTDLKKYFSKADSLTLDSALKLQDLAFSCFDSAELITDQAFYTINQPDLFKLFTRAYQVEKIGLIYQQKMYALFMKWNNSINNAIEEELVAYLSNKPTEENQNVKIIVRIKDSLDIKTVVVYDTVRIEPDKGLFTYKIQIAASKKEMSKNELRRIYPQDYMIEMEKEGPWYKYSVGSFTDYREAQNFKINTGVHDAFIVAWKDGKKVPIKEAVLVNKS